MTKFDEKSDENYYRRIFVPTKFIADETYYPKGSSPDYNIKNRQHI